MNLGFRAALWMALCGFIASGIIRNLDVLDKGAMQLQEAGLQALTHARCEPNCSTRCLCHTQQTCSAGKLSLCLCCRARVGAWSSKWRSRRREREEEPTPEECELQTVPLPAPPEEV